MNEPPSPGRPITRWLAILAVALAANSRAEAALEPYEATYEASLNSLPVTVTSTLETTPDGYRISTSAANFLGELWEQETFHLAGQRIVVDEYQHRRAMLGNQRLEQLVVDTGQGIARYRRDHETREIPLVPDLLGPMSYQVQLRRDLAAGDAEFAYAVLHRGKIKHYEFAREDIEPVALPSGTVDAIRVRRIRDDNDRETLFWMAPKLDFQLVKLRQIEDGDRYELLLTRLQAEAGGRHP
jgi:hypothetical protein